MATEDFEFLLSQYVDGTLPESQRASLEKHLAQNADLRALLAEYLRLNDVLHALPKTPPVRWDALAERISTELSDLPDPVRSYRLPVSWPTAVAAIAAMLLLGFSIAFQLIRTNAPAPTSVAIVSHAEVTGPQAETPVGTPLADVTLGPPPATADAQNPYSGVEDVVAQRPHIFIATADALPGVNRSIH